MRSCAGLSRSGCGTWQEKHWAEHVDRVLEFKPHCQSHFNPVRPVQARRTLDFCAVNT